MVSFPPGSLGSRKGLARLVTALAIPASALLIGTLHTLVLCGVTAVLTTGAFIAWFNGSPMKTRLPATIVLWTGVGLTVYTALQAVPLPAALVHAIDPTTADVWDRALTPLREPGPAWYPLSLDPIATRVQVLRGVAYVAAFLLALRVADDHAGTTFLSFVIAGTALVLGFTSVMHPILGATEVFGVYEPVQHGFDPRHLGPLLNPNHLAAYLNIGFCLALAVAFAPKGERLRLIAGAIAVLLAAFQIWVASRGGVLAMGLGAVLILVVSRMSRRFSVPASVTALLPALIVLAGLAMLALGSTPEVAIELGDRDTASKLQTAMGGLELARRHLALGVGRGAFEAAFPAVRTTLGSMTFTHPENVVAQWSSEWGVPVTVIAGALLVYGLRPAVLTASARPALGAWTALAVCFVHNFADFNSEVPAVAIACAVCAAMVVAGGGSAREGRVHRWATHPAAVAVGLACVAVTATALVIPGMGHELDEDRQSLYEQTTKAPPPADYRDQVAAALLRHPSEPYLPFVASVWALQRRESVIPWIERTLELSPIFPAAHFVLAQQLARIAQAQARVEYGLAISQEKLPSELVHSAITQALPLVATYEHATDLVPDEGPLRLPVLETLAEELHERLPATAYRLDARAMQVDPNARRSVWRGAGDAVADLESGDAAPWCTADRGSCAASTLSLADRLLSLVPDNCDALALRARALVLGGDPRRALRELDKAASNVSEPSACLTSLAELALASNHEEFAKSAEEKLAHLGCADDVDCANNLHAAAFFAMRRRNPQTALGYLQRAHERQPDQAGILTDLAALASTLGMHGEALAHYRELSTLTADPHWQDLAAREQIAVDAERARDAFAIDGGAPRF
jgi:tetratricopeptide (TPR) repeat protein